MFPFVLLFIFIFFFILNSVVARSNHTYCLTCCLPGVQSGKAITPMASKYPEDLQHLGLRALHDSCTYLQKAKAVLGANSSRVTTLALMGKKWSENCSFAATPSCLKAANMHKCSSCLTLSLWLQRCTTFFLVFATKLILHIFFSIDLEKNKIRSYGSLLRFPATPQMGSDMSKHLHPTFLIWQHISPNVAKLVPSPVQLLVQAPPANVFTLLFLVGPQIGLKLSASSKSPLKPASSSTPISDLERSTYWIDHQKCVILSVHNLKPPP